MTILYLRYGDLISVFNVNYMQHRLHNVDQPMPPGYILLSKNGWHTLPSTVLSCGFTKRSIDKTHPHIIIHNYTKFTELKKINANKKALTNNIYISMTVYIHRYGWSTIL